MTNTAKFRMKLASLEPGVSYGAVSFAVDLGNGSFVDPIVREVCGESMDYGKLFAYLFRRFGYPNRGWDDYKQLTKYILTTPQKDMLLEVVPYVGNSTRLHFMFLVPAKVNAAVENYDQRYRVAWQERALAWRDALGLPNWMNEWIDFINNTLGPLYGTTPAAVTNWRESLRWATTLGEPGTPYYPMTKQASDFKKDLYAQYETIESNPGYCERSSNWREWEAEDPIKPYAEAAFAALKDLRRPVRVRDQAIDAWGAAKYSARILGEPPVAGYPCGVLGNGAPKEFAELHGLIMRLGKGNSKKGIAKALAALKHLDSR